MWPGVLPSARRSRPATMWARRQSGSRGTLRRSMRAETRLSSARASLGRSRCSRTSSAHTQSKEPSSNGSSYADAAWNDRRPPSRCLHSASSAGTPRSTPTVVMPVSRSIRDVTTPSPQPTSRIELGRMYLSEASISSRKRSTNARVTGLPDAYLSVALPRGPTKSAASAERSVLSGAPLRRTTRSFLARPAAPRAVTSRAPREARGRRTGFRRPSGAHRG